MALKVVDFFCGCGGTSAGLRKAGLEIILGLDFDPDAGKTYKANFKTAGFIDRDINQVTFAEISSHLKLSADDSLVFCGCAPCQPFTKINTKKRRRDGRRSLLKRFGRFVKKFKPDYVIVENVPGIQAVDTTSGPFKDFLDLLEAEGYGGERCRFEVVGCQFYGVPQCRRRLILIATRHGVKAPWPQKTHGPEGTRRKKLPTVWEKIKDLPPIAAGETHASIPHHRTMNLSQKNLERIMATPPEMGRESWPPELDLGLACHEGHEGHSDVYGRLKKHAPAAALTTKCVSLSNGRFGHPEQDRAISLREAALLQTFPKRFKFEGSMGSIARQIGNAVPVSLAEQIGLAVAEHDRIRRLRAEVAEV